MLASWFLLIYFTTLLSILLAIASLNQQKTKLASGDKKVDLASEI